MYDTINFRLTAKDACNIDFLEETPCYLNNIAHHIFSGVPVVTGDLGGLKVVASKWQVKVKDASLCKWYLGDNFQELGRGTTQQAIEKLSDDLHLPMDRATITRLDVGVNIITKHPPLTYLTHMGVLAHAQRLQQPKGLYYSKSDEMLCFYDKVMECKAHNELLPPLYRGRNVLRYEQRCLHRLPSRLSVPVVTGGLLYDEAFYIALLDRFLKTYKAINKINDIKPNFKMIKGKKDLQRFGVLSLIERFGGEIELTSQINEAQQRGELTSKQAYDLRVGIKQACKTKVGLVVPNEQIAELDKKLYEAVKFYR